MRGVGAPHRRLVTARADLKASVDLAWTMLVLSLFQAIMVRGKKMIVCTVLCYSLGFQGSGHGYGIGYGLHFGQCSLGGLEDGYFGWFSGGLDIFEGGLLEPASQPPCRERSAVGLHAVLAE